MGSIRQTKIKVDEGIREILRESMISGDGTILRLPNRQLDRYADVKRTLERLGGKWNRPRAGFVFPKDVTAEIEALRTDGQAVDEKNTYQAFYTPPEVVGRMISLARLEKGAASSNRRPGTGGSRSRRRGIASGSTRSRSVGRSATRSSRSLRRTSSSRTSTSSRPGPISSARSTRS